jgi:hypothetical protein
MAISRRGVTLIELVITTAIVTMVILGVGVALVDTQRGWNKMYNRVYGEVAADSYVAKMVFDKNVRKASKKRYILGTNSLTVFYYAGLASTTLDRYANFRRGGSQLLVDFGEVDASGSPRSPSTTMVAARNVTATDFAVDGACVRMALKLNDGTESVSVTCSAIRHNE